MRRLAATAYRGGVSRNLPASRGIGITGPKASTIVVHRYCTEVAFDLHAGSGPKGITFAANGAYHPEYKVTKTTTRTGLEYPGGAASGIVAGGLGSVSHQPKAWDQMVPMFRKATVIKSNMTMQYLPCTSAGGQPGTPCTFGIYVDNDDNMNFATLGDFLESDKAGKRLKTAGGVPGDRVVTAKKYFNTAHHFGLMTDPASQHEYQCTDTTNPDKQAYFQAWVAAPSSASVPTDALNPDLVRFMITIEYTVKWTEPRILAQS